MFCIAARSKAMILAWDVNLECALELVPVIQVVALLLKQLRKVKTK